MASYATNNARQRHHRGVGNGCIQRTHAAGQPRRGPSRHDAEQPRDLDKELAVERWRPPPSARFRRCRLVDGKSGICGVRGAAWQHRHFRLIAMTKSITDDLRAQLPAIAIVSGRLHRSPGMVSSEGKEASSGQVVDGSAHRIKHDTTGRNVGLSTMLVGHLLGDCRHGSLLVDGAVIWIWLMMAAASMIAVDALDWLEMRRARTGQG